LSQLFLYVCYSPTPRNSKANPKLKPYLFSSYLSEIYIYKCILHIHTMYICIYGIYVYLNTSRCLSILIDKHRKYFTKIAEVNLLFFLSQAIRLCLQLSVLSCHHVVFAAVQKSSGVRRGHPCPSRVPLANWCSCLFTSELSGKVHEILNTFPYLQLFYYLKAHYTSIK